MNTYKSILSMTAKLEKNLTRHLLIGYKLRIGKTYRNSIDKLKISLSSAWDENMDDEMEVFTRT